MRFSDAKGVPLSPAQISALRQNYLRIVQDISLDVVDVLNGRKAWSTTQAHLFRTLLNKVLPDLSATYAEVHHVHTDIRTASRAELEAIAAGRDDEPKSLDEGSQKAGNPSDFNVIDGEAVEVVSNAGREAGDPPVSHDPPGAGAPPADASRVAVATPLPGKNPEQISKPAQEPSSV